VTKAKVYNFETHCGFIEEIVKGKNYKFTYVEDYSGKAISLTMPTNQREYIFNEFPPFFDGLLPEGFNLEALCRTMKVDRNDSFKQLLLVGKDVVGSVSVEPCDE